MMYNIKCFGQIEIYASNQILLVQAMMMIIFNTNPNWVLFQQENIYFSYHCQLQNKGALLYYAYHKTAEN